MADVMSLSRQERYEMIRARKNAEIVLKGAQGSFAGLLSGHPEMSDFQIEIKSGSMPTFGVDAPCKTLTALHFLFAGSSSIPYELCESYHPTDRTRSYEQYVKFWNWRLNQIGHQVTFYTPSLELLQRTSLSLKAARAVGAHEFGHPWCDEAMKLLSKEEYNQILDCIPHDEDYHIYNDHALVYDKKWRPSKEVPRIANLLADIRLERRLVARYPELVEGFGELQEWCWRLEEPVRAQGREMTLSLIRDLGKKHDSISKKSVLSEYSPSTWLRAMNTREIWSQVDENTTSLEIATLAIELFIAMGDESSLETPELEDKQKGDQKGDQDQESDQDQDQESDQDQDQDQESDQDQDQKGDQDQDQKSDQDQEGGQEGGQEGDQDQKGDQDSSQGNGQDQDEDWEGLDRSSEYDSSERDSVKERRQREALKQEPLDPSSAFEKDIESQGRKPWYRYAEIENIPFKDFMKSF